MVTIRSRGRLPHWEEAPAIYFVTFRLADSLPQAALKKIEFERRDILSTANAMHRNPSPAERLRLEALFDEKVETYLDAGSGRCHLANPEVARVVTQALLHFDGVRYRTCAWCLMPNHVHVVFRPLGGHALADVLHSWKSYSANRANRLLGRCGELWQHEYYDHLVRDERDFYRVVQYVLDNPANAKLANWPWYGARP